MSVEVDDTVLVGIVVVERGRLSLVEAQSE